MPTHLLLRGPKELVATYLPFAKEKLRQLWKLPFRNRVFRLDFGLIKIWRTNREGWVYIKVGYPDGYEFSTEVTNAVLEDPDDATYFYQTMNWRFDDQDNVTSRPGFDRNGYRIQPSQTVGSSFAYLVSVLEESGGVPQQQTQESPRATHFNNFDTTTRKVSRMLTSTEHCGKRGCTTLYAHSLYLDHSLWYGNNVLRTRTTKPKTIPYGLQPAGGMVNDNDVLISPAANTNNATFEFTNIEKSTASAYGLSLPSWVTADSGRHVAWHPNRTNDRMLCINHHRTWSNGYEILYEGPVELNLDASINPSTGAIENVSMTYGRIPTPDADWRFAAADYDLLDGTKAIVVRYRGYLSNSYHDAAADPGNTDQASDLQACRSLAIFAEWCELDGVGNFQAPFRTVLMFHGPFMGKRATGEGDSTDELASEYTLWNYNKKSDAFFEYAGYQYYEANICALDLRADAYCLQAFKPDDGSLSAGRWRIDYDCFGDGPYVLHSDDQNQFSEPTVTLANYTELTASHGAWEDYLVSVRDTDTYGDFRPNAPYNWYIGSRFDGFHDAIGPAGASEFRPTYWGGFQIHPNTSWSLWMNRQYNFLQQSQGAPVADVYAPASMIIDRVILKKWDDVAQTASVLDETSHKELINGIRDENYDYGEYAKYVELCCAATWGIDPEEYSK